MDTPIFIRCRNEFYMEVSNWMESLEKEKLCTSVFKDGSDATTKDKLFIAAYPKRIETNSLKPTTLAAYRTKRPC